MQKHKIAEKQRLVSLYHEMVHVTSTQMPLHVNRVEKYCVSDTKTTHCSEMHGKLVHEINSQIANI